MKYALFNKTYNIVNTVDNTGQILFDSIEEIENKVKCNYLFRNNRDKFCKNYTIVGIDTNNEVMKHLDYSFIDRFNSIKKTNTDVKKINKIGFKKAIKDFIKRQDRHNNIFEYGNMKVINNHDHYSIYIKNVTYIEVINDKNTLINSGSEYLYLTYYYANEFTNDMIDSLYDTYIKQNATTDDKTVYYLNYYNQLSYCPKNQWNNGKFKISA